MYVIIRVTTHIEIREMSGGGVDKEGHGKVREIHEKLSKSGENEIVLQMS